MPAVANATFTIASWDEKPYSEGDSLPRLTRAAVNKRFTGDVEGESHVEYLMMYRADKSATFVGLEQFTGKIDGRSGTFVLQRTCGFEHGRAKETYTVVAGSGTGDLRSLRGHGASSLSHAAEYPFELTYDLD